MRTRSRWWRWTVTVTLGELVGFTVPALAGATAAASELDETWTYLLLLPAGFVEGLCLGYAQGWALRRDLPRLSARSLAVATALAAVLAYALGMLPSALGERLGELPTPLLVLAGVAGGAVLLGSIGTAQWLVLTRAGVRARWWVLTTAGAWLVGLAVFMLVATPLWHVGQPVWQTVGVGVLGGALMAATVAALTGLAAVRLEPASWH